jgi:glycerol kinase
MVVDRDGAVLGLSQKEFKQYFPFAGWVEHDPDEIWASQIGVATEAVGAAGLQLNDVAALGITNQRETTLVWERSTGRPIYRAIVWQDRRTSGLCEKLKAEGAESVLRERTGLLLDPYFSATKIRWILDHVDGARAQAERGALAFGTVDTWLLWKLTGGSVHATDPSNASRTLLFNLKTGDWDPDLCALFGIPEAMLPEVLPSAGHFGEASFGMFGRAVPIAGMAGDQQAALFGQVCFRPGMAKNTYGTGCFLMLHIGDQPMTSRHHLLTTCAWSQKMDGAPRLEYALEGSVFMAGAIIQWLRDGLQFFQASSEIEAMAQSVHNSGGVFLVPAFTGLGAPHWDPYARGLLIGMDRGTTRAHIARAALDAIAYQTCDLLIAMQRDAGFQLQELRVDGGASANDLLMQIQADMLGVPVVRPRVTETTALGAAYLAGLGAGFWPNQDALTSQWRIDRRFEPTLKRSEANSRLARWQHAVERSREWEKTP